jgi:glutathione S-transferase
MTEYKYNYFNLKGRGEIVRIIFAAAGQKFIDNRIEFNNWPSIKPTAPFGQVNLIISILCFYSKF